MPERLAADLDGAYAEVIALHQDDIYSGVRRLVPNRADTEDLTQETFVKAYRALERYEPERIRTLQLRAWLWTIALNLCRNAARSRSRRPRLVAIDLVAEPASPGSVEQDALDLAFEEVWQLRLDQLSRRHRVAVVLRYVVDLSYAEIGAALKRPEATVRSDVHRGLERLRDILLAERQIEQG